MSRHKPGPAPPRHSDVAQYGPSGGAAPGPLNRQSWHGVSSPSLGVEAHNKPSARRLGPNAACNAILCGTGRQALFLLALLPPRPAVGEPRRVKKFAAARRRPGPPGGGARRYRIYWHCKILCKSRGPLWLGCFLFIIN